MGLQRVTKKEGWQNNVVALMFFLSLSLLCFSNNSYAAVDVEKGYQWLLSQRNADGAFVVDNSVATPQQAVLQAVKVLTLAEKLTLAERDKAAAALPTPKEWTTFDIYHRVLLSTDSIEKKKLVTKLLSHQAENGGFSHLPNYESNVLDSSLALIVLSASESDAVLTQSIATTINFIKSKQQPNGSFRYGDMATTDRFVTSLVSQALMLFRNNENIDKLLLKSNKFLLDQQSDLVIAENWLAAMSLNAIVSTELDHNVYAVTLDKLRSTQLANGSWDNDVYTTSLVLEAILLSNDLTLPSDILFGRVTGQVVNNQTKQPIPYAFVELKGAKSYVRKVGSDGTFFFNDVDVGAYTATVKANGFSALTQQIYVDRERILNIGSLSLNIEPNTSVVHGRITDSETGEPIRNAQVKINGNIVAVGDLGQYATVVNQGSVSIAVSAPTYLNVDWNGDVQSGQSYHYSPKLAKTVSTEPALVVSGKVLDAHTLQPILGAKLVANGVTSAVMSDEQGNFTLKLNLNVSEITITTAEHVALTKTVFGSLGNHVEAGNFYLMPIQKPAETLITGQVIDKQSRKPIAGAFVKVGGTTAQSTTDWLGNYRLSVLSSDKSQLMVGAAGYLSQSLGIDSKSPDRVMANFELEPASRRGLLIDSLQLSHQYLEAYQNLDISFIVNNSSDVAKNIVVVNESLSASGEVLSKRILSRESISQQNNLTDTILPREAKQYTNQWHSGITPPGSYISRVQVFDESTHVLLAEKSIPFNIVKTQKIGSLELVPRPQFGYVGQSVSLDILGKIENRSNVAIDVEVGYVIQQPNSGTVIVSGQFIKTLLPQQMTVDLTAPKVLHNFSVPGEYHLITAVHSLIKPSLIVTKPITVVSSRPLDITQGINPSQVIPVDKQKVTIKIDLEGK